LLQRWRSHSVGEERSSAPEGAISIKGWISIRDKSILGGATNLNIFPRPSNTDQKRQLLWKKEAFFEAASNTSSHRNRCSHGGATGLLGLPSRFGSSVHRISVRAKAFTTLKIAGRNYNVSAEPFD
jgi:hypothetical protein